MTDRISHLPNDPAASRRLRPATPTQRLLTVPQASEYSGVPVRSLWDCIYAGGLATVRLPGQTRRTWVDRRDLDALIESSRKAHTGNCTINRDNSYSTACAPAAILLA